MRGNISAYSCLHNGIACTSLHSMVWVGFKTDQPEKKNQETEPVGVGLGSNFMKTNKLVLGSVLGQNRPMLTPLFFSLTYSQVIK